MLLEETGGERVETIDLAEANRWIVGSPPVLHPCQVNQPGRWILTRSHGRA